MTIGKEISVIYRISMSAPISGVGRIIHSFPFIVNGHSAPLTICLTGIGILERIGVSFAAICDIDHGVFYTAVKRSIAKVITIARVIISTAIINFHNRIVNPGKVILIVTISTLLNIDFRLSRSKIIKILSFFLVNYSNIIVVIGGKAVRCRSTKIIPVNRSLVLIV